MPKNIPSTKFSEASPGATISCLVQYLCGHWGWLWPYLQMLNSYTLAKIMANSICSEKSVWSNEEIFIHRMTDQDSSLPTFMVSNITECWNLKPKYFLQNIFPSKYLHVWWNIHANFILFWGNRMKWLLRVTSICEANILAAADILSFIPHICFRNSWIN